MANKVSKPKYTSQKTETEYKKQLRRIKQQISRAKKKGYRFSTDIIPKPKNPEKIAIADVRKLEELTSRKIYKQATALSEITGKEISGTERQKEIRREAGIRASITRKNRENVRQAIHTYESQVQPTTFEQKIRQRDEEQKQKLSTDKDFQSSFNAGLIAYGKVEDMINDVIKHDYNNVGQYLKSRLQAEIDQYGFDNVMASIGKTPQAFIEQCELILQYQVTSDKIDNHISKLSVLIAGEIPSAKTMQDIDDRISQDEYE